MRPRVDAEILRLAGFGLAGLPPIPRTGWSERLDAVAAHGLTGLLASAWRQGWVDVDAATAAALQELHEQQIMQSVRLEAELLRMSPLIEEHGAVVLKGAVLAHGAYPSPNLRPFTDVDLLVPTRSLPAAMNGLRRLGYRPVRPDPTPAFSTRIAKATVLVHPTGLIVDVHRTLLPGPVGERIDVDEITGAAIRVRAGALNLAAPDWDAHLIEVAIHAVAGDGLRRGLSIRDVAQVALHPAIDTARVRDLCNRWDVTGIVGAALRATRDGLGVSMRPGLASFADVLVPTPWTTMAPRHSLSARARVGDIVRGRPRRRLAALRAAVAPTPAFLHWNYGDHPLPALYWRRWKDGMHRTADAVRPSRPVELAPPPRSTAGRSPSQLLAPRVAGTIASGTVDPSVPGARWWMYQRPPAANVAPSFTAAHQPLTSGAGTPPPPPDDGGRRTSEAADGPRAAWHAGLDVAGRAKTGVSLAVIAVLVLMVTSIDGRSGAATTGPWLVPIAGVLFAASFGRRFARIHPDEPWLARWLVIGVVAKIGASYFRYLTLVNTYNGSGDAAGYDKFGRQFASAWLHGLPSPDLTDLRKTNFIRWFTGVVYWMFGANMLAGFFVFGLLAVVGSYLWYRATVGSIPFVDRRLYLGFVLFAPSIAFWPSSIGKEALMQLGIGVVAIGTANLLRNRLVHGLAVCAAGGWLLWVVRPHLLALVAFAGGVAYIAGRVRRASGLGSLLSRPVGAIVIAILVAFTLSQGAKFLGMKDFSLQSIQAELDDQTARSEQGGSSFDNGGNSLSPLSLPHGAVTVLLRPFPWETDSALQLLASMESVIVAALMVVRFSSLRAAVRRARDRPFLLYCWVLLALYSATFSSFANFGLLVRQRSLVLPALFVLLAVDANAERQDRSREIGRSDDQITSPIAHAGA